ncbi:HNH endonuclease signature motif containing protein [Dactylosporangium sp. CA-139066]|uniref:HNH endonuclease signature motif containing protein n=1 Tax=Dactylosporangium sp. CA-139066 TaxID=3239930 RepID=UPI003D8D829C
MFFQAQIRDTRWHGRELRELTMADIVELLNVPTVTVDGVKDERLPVPTTVGRPATPIADRFWARLDADLDPVQCWHWTGTLSYYRYGTITTRKKVRQAHVVAYESVHGPVPDGYQVDHTCHNADPDCPGNRDCLHRRCVNPAHLEAVTPAENKRRAHDRIRKPVCPQGHPMDGDNLYVNPVSGQRACKTCKRAKVRRWYESNKDAYNASRRRTRAA